VLKNGPNMKKLMTFAAMAPLMLATPAIAASANYSVTGTVTAICTAASTGTLDFGTGGLANTSTGVVLASATQSSTDATAVCNGNSTTITVAHVAMQTAATTSASGFTNTIDFTPRVTINGANLDNNRTNTTVGPFSGMTVTALNLTTAASAKPIAGSYNAAGFGTISITLTPGP
jgi:hypothetical protein